MERSRKYSSGVLTLKFWLIVGSLIALGVAFTVQVASTPVPIISMGGAPTVEASVVPQTAANDTIARATQVPTTEDEGPEQDVESFVRTYFSDVPVLAEIARCESHFRQNDVRTGTVLRGLVNRDDVGVMQINTRYHATTAQKLGYNLYTLAGNLAYARHLYEREGTRPWSASRACWAPGHIAMR